MSRVVKFNPGFKVKYVALSRTANHFKYDCINPFFIVGFFNTGSLSPKINKSTGALDNTLSLSSTAFDIVTNRPGLLLLDIDYESLLLPPGSYIFPQLDQGTITPAPGIIINSEVNYDAGNGNWKDTTWDLAGAFYGPGNPGNVQAFVPSPQTSITIKTIFAGVTRNSKVTPLITDTQTQVLDKIKVAIQAQESAAIPGVTAASGEFEFFVNTPTVNKIFISNGGDSVVISNFYRTLVLDTEDVALDVWDGFTRYAVILEKVLS